MLLEIGVVVRVTTRYCVLSNSDGTSKRNVPLLDAVLVATSLKPLENGKPWRSSATRVPPTAVPARRPITLRAPLHTTRLGASVMLTPVISRVVTNERSRLRVEPVPLVATARKW